MKRVYGVVSIVPNERNAVWSALLSAGYTRDPGRWLVSATSGEVCIWSRKDDGSRVVEACIGSATNTSSVAALREMEKVARIKRLFIDRVVVYACAGGLFDPRHAGALISPKPKREIGRWITHSNLVYRVGHVVYGAWGSVENSCCASGGVTVRTRVHEPIFPKPRKRPEPGHPETRRMFEPVSGHAWEAALNGATTPATALAVESVYHAHPLSWQIAHSGWSGPPATVKKGTAAFATRVEYRDVSQLVQRLIYAANTGSANSMALSRIALVDSQGGSARGANTMIGRAAPDKSAVIVEMESLGLWSGLAPDAVVLRVVTDMGSNKDQVSMGQPKNWTWHLASAAKPTKPSDKAQAYILWHRSKTLAKLFSRPNVVQVKGRPTVESLLVSIWLDLSLHLQRWQDLVEMLRSSDRLIAVTGAGKLALAALKKALGEVEELDQCWDDLARWWVSSAFFQLPEVLGDYRNLDVGESLRLLRAFVSLVAAARYSASDDDDHIYALWGFYSDYSPPDSEWPHRQVDS